MTCIEKGKIIVLYDDVVDTLDDEAYLLTVDDDADTLDDGAYMLTLDDDDDVYTLVIEAYMLTLHMMYTL